jgi:hypothetical protein
MDPAIDFKALLASSKKRLTLDFKQIKKVNMYNYLNDGVNTILVDCRPNYEENCKNENGYLRNSYWMNNFPKSNIEVKTNTRLILIIQDSSDIKNGEEFILMRNFIQNEDKLDKGLFFIYNTDYQIFIKQYPWFLINKESSEIDIQLAQTQHPLIILDGILYCGNFFNSRNLFQINNLNIQSIIALLNEEDKDLKEKFGNYTCFEVDEQSHEEFDYTEIIDHIDEEISYDKKPILLHCFSGQTLSLAACIAYLMKHKKWQLEFATAYIMKIYPGFNIPPWLYTQLLRVNLDKYKK